MSAKALKRLMVRVNRLEAKRGVADMSRPLDERLQFDLEYWRQQGRRMIGDMGLRFKNVRPEEQKAAEAYLTEWRKKIRVRLKAIADLEE